MYKNKKSIINLHFGKLRPPMLKTKPFHGELVTSWHESQVTVRALTLGIHIGHVAKKSIIVFFWEPVVITYKEDLYWSIDRLIDWLIDWLIEDSLQA